MSTEPEDQSAPPPAPEQPVTPQAPPPGQKSDKKMIAGILGLSGILWGGWGVHKFYLGYTKEGVIQLCLTLLCGVGTLIGIIEGIIYLTKTDEEFEATYVQGKKPWF